jgi:hypothetical protein
MSAVELEQRPPEEKLRLREALFSDMKTLILYASGHAR